MSLRPRARSAINWVSVVIGRAILRLSNIWSVMAMPISITPPSISAMVAVVIARSCDAAFSLIAAVSWSRTSRSGNTMALVSTALPASRTACCASSRRPALTQAVSRSLHWRRQRVASSRDLVTSARSAGSLSIAISSRLVVSYSLRASS